jgi:hypothetical protein
MKGFRRNTAPTAILIALAALIMAGCGGDSGTPPPSSDLERMAGSWQGIEFRLTSQQAPIRTFDLIDADGTFRLDIQASGRYAATLTLGGEIAVESGRFELSGNQFTQTPTNPPGPPVTGTWTMANDNSLTLSGIIEFDFDPGDGTANPEPADALIVMVRR